MTLVSKSTLLVVLRLIVGMFWNYTNFDKGQAASIVASDV